MGEQRYSNASRFTALYDNQGHLLAVSPIWRAGDYQQPTTPLTHSGAVSHATAVTVRVGLMTALDEGWLTFDTIKVTSLSDPITARPGQLQDLTVQVSGQLTSADGGRLFVKYSDGTMGYEWRNTAVFNGSQNISGNFTTPSGISSFQVGTEVVLDKGHLAFSSVVLRAWSDPIAVTAGDGYQFEGQVAGSLVAPVGQGGQIVARYSNAAGGDAGVDVLWDNPVNFNGTAQVQHTFNANPGATTMRLMLITNLDAGHLTYSNFGLQHMVTGYSTIQRTTYSVAGQSVAVKVAGDPVSGNNGLFFLYSDHLGSANAMQHPDGSVTQTRYLPFGGYRSGGSNPITDRGFTGHKHNDSLDLIYMNARYYVVGISRFASADTLVPDPTNPQSYNRYTYVNNRPLHQIDPTGHIACNFELLPDEGRCQGDGSWASGTVVYYLNGLGGQEVITPGDLDRTQSEYSYLLFVLQNIYDEASVFHVPVFTNEFRGWASRAEMVSEAIGKDKPWTNIALNFILENPPYPGEEVVIVGASAGGTIGVELLRLLEAEGVFVDKLILRGSFVMENRLTNVGEVHYLAGDPPLSDFYYSVDINPFDAVRVQQHIVPGLTHHAPGDTGNPTQALRNIGALIVDILSD